MKQFLVVIVLAILALQGCSKDTTENFKATINSAARDIDSKF